MKNPTSNHEVNSRLVVRKNSRQRIALLHHTEERTPLHVFSSACIMDSSRASWWKKMRKTITISNIFQTDHTVREQTQRCTNALRPWMIQLLFTPKHNFITWWTSSMKLTLLNENIHEKYSARGDANLIRARYAMTNCQSGFGNSDCMY